MRLAELLIEVVDGSSSDDASIVRGRLPPTYDLLCESVRRGTRESAEAAENLISALAPLLMNDETNRAIIYEKIDEWEPAAWDYARRRLRG